LLLPVGYWVMASRVPILELDSEAFGGALVGLATPRYHLLSAAFPAIVGGYVLVEIGAAAVPAWRPLRRTQRGRAVLARAAFVGALVFTVAIAWALPGPAPLAELLTGSSLIPILTLLGATALFWMVIHASERRSVGSVIALLVGLSLTFDLVRLGIVEPWFTAADTDLPQPATSLALTSLALAATLAVLRSRVREGAGDGRLSVRVPLGGLAAFWGAQSVWPLVLIGVASSKLPGLTWAPGYAAAVVLGFVVVVLVELFSWRASSSAVVGPLFDAGSSPAGASAGVGASAEVGASAGVGERADGGIGAAYAPPREPVAREGAGMAPERARAWAVRTRRLLVRALVPTVAYLAIVAWPAWPVLDHPDRSGRVVGAMAGACLLVAVVLDLIAETRFRLAHPGAVSVHMHHHVGAADAAVTALAEAEVPAFARNVHVRTLLSFFGPFAPIDILVPASKLPVAQERLARILPAPPEMEPPPAEAAPEEPQPSPKRSPPRRRRKRPDADARFP
jgi:hypothetical protein